MSTSFLLTVKQSICLTFKSVIPATPYILLAVVLHLALSFLPKESHALLSGAEFILGTLLLPMFILVINNVNKNNDFHFFQIFKNAFAQFWRFLLLHVFYFIALGSIIYALVIGTSYVLEMVTELQYGSTFSVWGQSPSAEQYDAMRTSLRYTSYLEYSFYFLSFVALSIYWVLTPLLISNHKMKLFSAIGQSFRLAQKHWVKTFTLCLFLLLITVPLTYLLHFATNILLISPLAIKFVDVLFVYSVVTVLGVSALTVHLDNISK